MKDPRSCAGIQSMANRSHPQLCNTDNSAMKTLNTNEPPEKAKVWYIQQGNNCGSAGNAQGQAAALETCDCERAAAFLHGISP
jgi:hypothetical protein